MLIKIPLWLWIASQPRQQHSTPKTFPPLGKVKNSRVSLLPQNGVGETLQKVSRQFLDTHNSLHCFLDYTPVSYHRYRKSAIFRDHFPMESHGFPQPPRNALHLAVSTCFAIAISCWTSGSHGILEWLRYRVTLWWTNIAMEIMEHQHF